MVSSEKFVSEKIMSCCVQGCNSSMRLNKEFSFHIFPHPEKEPFRHGQWIEATNNPKLKKIEPMLVFNRYRICRKHFARWCFNGDCKRLMKSAVPTLFLDGEKCEEESEDPLHFSPPKRRKLNTETSTADLEEDCTGDSVVIEKIQGDPEDDEIISIIPIEEDDKDNDFSIQTISTSVGLHNLKKAVSMEMSFIQDEDPENDTSQLVCHIGREPLSGELSIFL